MDYFSSLRADALDPDIPTLFELLSAHQLQTVISPSLRYILAFYAQRHPQYLLRIANRYDELYLVLMGCVEYYHLKNWNSSFTEKFYGIKRTKALSLSALRAKSLAPEALEKHRRLTRRQVLGSFFFVTILPYVKDKLDHRYEVLKGRYMFRSAEQDREALRDHPVHERVLFELDMWLLKWYPTVTMSQSMVALAFYLLFLFTKTTSSGPADYLLGMKYSRMNAFDYAMHDAPIPPDLSEDDEEFSRPFASRLLDLVATGQGLKAVKDAALSGLSYTLPSSMFLLKFLEWWNASDFAHQLAKKSRGSGDDENLPVPYSDDSKLATNWQGLCPLCGKEIAGPTAIETGVVFCYTCIFRHLENGDREKGGRCPVTGQRLLGCRYSEDTESWEINGLRRLIV